MFYFCLQYDTIVLHAMVLGWKARGDGCVLCFRRLLRAVDSVALAAVTAVVSAKCCILRTAPT